MDDVMNEEIKARKGKMPGTTNPKVEAAVAEVVPPPDAPLDPGGAAALVAALNAAFDALLPGEDIPPVAFEAEEAVDDLPDDVKARVVALGQFLKSKNAKYQLDPVALRSDEGITDLTVTLQTMAKDQNFLRGVTSGPMKLEEDAPDEAEPSPAPAPDRSATPKFPKKGME